MEGLADAVVVITDDGEFIETDTNEDLKEDKDNNDCSILDNIVNCNLLRASGEKPVETKQKLKFPISNVIENLNIKRSNVLVNLDPENSNVIENLDPKNANVIENRNPEKSTAVGNLDPENSNVVEPKNSDETEIGKEEQIENITLSNKAEHSESPDSGVEGEGITKNIEILHLQENRNRFLCSRNNSDIRIWMENLSQYSFTLQKTVRPLTKQLSHSGLGDGAHTMRFAFLTDEILNKLCETTGEVLKSGQIFTRRIWSCWYPEKNALASIEAWQWIILDAIYRLNPLPQHRHSSKNYIKLSLKLLKNKYKILIKKLELIMESARNAKSAVKKIKRAMKHKYLRNKIFQKLEGPSEIPAIPIRNSRPKYRTVKMIPVLRKDDLLVKCGERGLLIKTVMGSEIHFDSLDYSSKLEMFHLFIKEVVHMADKSQEKLENALANLSFVIPYGETVTKKTTTQRHFEEIKSIVFKGVNFFIPAVKPLMTAQFERMEGEIKDIISAAEGRIAYFCLQAKMVSLFKKNVSSIMKGKFINKQKAEALTTLKEFHMKISKFPPNPESFNFIPRDVEIPSGLTDFNQNFTPQQQHKTIFIESNISGLGAMESWESSSAMNIEDIEESVKSLQNPVKI